jgi:alkanesulfonate monooxygenase SsuD/methylene tetrahydromethanopterin reductase-like flavin-dependent oxidoreductase (luciferase family)
MKVGVTLPVFTSDVAATLDGARRAHHAGLDSVWVYDHMWPLGGPKERTILECYSTLAYLAAATEDITIGTLVTRSTLRNAALLAKMVATVGLIAPGRVTVAIGSGDAASRPENDAFGLPYVGGKERARQLEATVTTVRTHLHGDGPLPGPRPTPPPPVWVGGRSPAMLDIAGRVADGWNAWGATVEDFAREAEVVRAAAGGRAVALTWAGSAVIAPDDTEARVKLGDRDPGAYLVGGPETLGAHLAALGAAGCSHAILGFPDASRPGSYELLGDLARTLVR